MMFASGVENEDLYHADHLVQLGIALLDMALEARDFRALILGFNIVILIFLGALNPDFRTKLAGNNSRVLSSQADKMVRPPGVLRFWFWPSRRTPLELKVPLKLWGFWVG